MRPLNSNSSSAESPISAPPIAAETGVTSSADPLGGSYLVEALTLDIEKRALELIEKIDGLGGALEAIESGFMHNEISEAEYQAQRRLESKEDIVVGVNEYT